MTVSICKSHGLFMALMVSVVTACGGADTTVESPPALTETSGAQEDHVWTDQVDAIERAREAESTLLDAQEKRAKALDEDL